MEKHEFQLSVNPLILREFEVAATEFYELTYSKPRVLKVIETQMTDFSRKVMGATRRVRSEQNVD